MASSASVDDSGSTSANHGRQSVTSKTGFFDFSKANTCLDRLGLQIVRSLFGTLALLTRQQEDSRFNYVFIATIRFLQLSSFIVASNSALPWGNSPVALAYGRAVSYLAPASASKGSAFQPVLFAIAAAWTAGVCATACFIAVSFMLDWPQNGLLLRVYRWAGSLTASVLYLPISGLLFQGISCTDNDWLGTGAECSSPARIITAVVAIIFVLILTVLALLVASVFHDKDPTSASWAAKATGRLDVAVLCIMLTLSLVSNLLADQLLGTIYMTLVHLGCGALWYYLTSYMLVHPLPELNALMGGFAATYLWFGVSLAIGQASSEGQDHSAFLLLGGAVAGLAGGTLVYVRQFHVTSMRLEEFSAGASSVYDVNAWIRFRLRQMAKLESLADATTAQAYAAAAAQEQEDSEQRTAPQAAEAEEGKAGTSTDGITRRGGSNNKKRDDGVSAAVDRASRHRQQEQSRLLRESFRGMHFLLTQFPQSEMACMLASIGFRDHSPWLFHEAMALARARALSPSLDVLFHIYHRSTQLRETGSEGSSPIDRVLFDQMFNQAQEARTKCFQLLTRLWANMSHVAPDLDKLWSIGLQLQRTLHSADSLHRSMLDLNSDSTSALRAYAKHLLDLGQDPDKAQEYLNKADRLEEVHRQDKRKVVRTVTMLAPAKPEQTGPNGDEHGAGGGTAGMASASAVAAKRRDLAARGMIGMSAAAIADVKAARLSIMDESSAVISISGQGSSIGEIVAASPAACRMLGYSQAALLGHNINSVLPEPIRSAHDSLLSRFAAAPRQRTRVMNRDRAVFYQRQDGSLVPAWNTIIESPPDERTFEPRFTAVMRPIVSEDDYITFAPVEGGFRMYAATQKSVDLLGLSHDQIGDGRAHMLSYFPTLAPSFDSATVELNRDQIRQLKAQPAVHDIRRQFGLRRNARRPRRSSVARSHARKVAKRPSESGLSESDQRSTSGDQTGYTVETSQAETGRGQLIQSRIDGALGAESSGAGSGEDRGKNDRAPPGILSSQSTAVGQIGKRKRSLLNMSGWHEDHTSERALLARAATSVSLKTDAPAGTTEHPSSHGPGSRTADVKPLLSLMNSKVGLIPAVGTPQGDVLLLGSVQFVPLPIGAGDFFVLRWRFVDKNQEAELNRKNFAGNYSSSDESDSDGGSDGASDIALGSRVYEYKSMEESRASRPSLGGHGDNGDAARQSIAALASGGLRPGASTDEVKPLLQTKRAVRHEDAVLVDSAATSTRLHIGASVHAVAGHQQLVAEATAEKLFADSDNDPQEQTQSTVGKEDMQGTSRASSSDSGASPPESERSSAGGAKATAAAAGAEGKQAEADSKVPGPWAHRPSAHFFKENGTKPRAGINMDDLSDTDSREPLEKKTASKRRSKATRMGTRRKVDANERNTSDVINSSNLQRRSLDVTAGAVRWRGMASGSKGGTSRITSGGLQSPSMGKSKRASMQSAMTGGGMGGGQSMMSSGSNAVLAVRRNVRNLGKLTEPEVTRSRQTLAFLVVAVLVIGTAQLIWLDAQLDRLSALTVALTKGGERMLQFEYGMSYAENLDRYSTWLEAANATGSSNASMAVDLLDIHDAAGDTAGYPRDVAMMAAHSNAMRQRHEHLFDIQEAGGKDAFHFELDRSIQVQQPNAEAPGSQPSNRTINLVDLGLEMYTAFTQLGQLHIEEMNQESAVPLQFLQLNYYPFMDAMNESLALRQRDFATAMPRIQRDIILGGMLSFAVCVCLAAPIFYSAVRDIAERTQAVTMLLLHVPRRLAKALKDRAQSSLDRMVVEQEDYSNGASAGTGGVDDEDEEKRLIVQEADGEEVYRNVLKAAERQVFRRLEQHAKNMESKGSQSELLPGRRSRRVMDGVPVMDIESAQSDLGHGSKDSPMTTNDMLGGRPIGVSSSKYESAMSEHRMVAPSGAVSSGGGDQTIPPPSRPYTSSSNFICRKVCLFMSPVTLVLGLLLFTALYLRSRMISTETAIKRVVVVEQSALHASGALRQSIKLVLGRAGTHDQLEAYDRVAQHDRLLTEQSELIQFGGTTTSDYTAVSVDLPPLPSSSAALDLLMHDACSPVYTENWPSRQWDGVLPKGASSRSLPQVLKDSNTSSILAAIEVDSQLQFDDCVEVEGGIMTHGLLNTLVSIGSIVKELLSQLSPSSSAAVSMDSANNRHRVLRMVSLELPHMREAYGLVLRLMDDEVAARLSTTRGVMTIVTYVFAAAFTIAVGVYYWPAAGSLQESLQSARELLTLVPEEVQDVVVPLRRGLQVISAKQETGEQGLPGLKKHGSIMCCGYCC